MLQDRATLRPIDQEVVATLRKNVAGTGGRRHALESLWTLHVTGALDAALVTTALAHEDEAVRAWAVRLATETRGSKLVAAEQLLKLAKVFPR